MIRVTDCTVLGILFVMSVLVYSNTLFGTDCRILISAEKNRNCIALWKTPDLSSESGTCIVCVG